MHTYKKTFNTVFKMGSITRWVQFHAYLNDYIRLKCPKNR